MCVIAENERTDGIYTRIICMDTLHKSMRQCTANAIHTTVAHHVTALSLSLSPIHLVHSSNASQYVIRTTFHFIFFSSTISDWFIFLHRQSSSSCPRYCAYRAWPTLSQIYQHSRIKPVWPKIWSFWHRCPNCAMSHFWLAIHGNRCARWR